MLVASGEEAGGGQTEIGAERHLAQLHVVDVRRHAVHAVGGGDGHGVVETGLAENAEAEVDGFVATVAHKNLLGRQALDLREQRLELLLVRVGVAVHAVVVRTLVGIEPHGNVAALVVVAGGGVRRELAYVFAHGA